MRSRNHPTGGRRRLALGAAVTTLAALVAQPGMLTAPAGAHGKPSAPPRLESRDVPILAKDGIRFRDLNRDGRLTPYEDWRLSATARARDLLSRMTLEEKAGLLVHGNLPTAGDGYDAAATAQLVGDRHVTTAITRLSKSPEKVAAANNSVQAIAEKQRLGIPAVISTDPRNGFSVVEGQTVAGAGTTAMPDAIGIAAAHNTRLTERLGDIVRREYRAVGITEGLSPQADIATEPRWTRIDGTFGSDPETAGRQVNAYVKGMQHGADGLGPDSAATVTKHWVGYGAQANGYDSHYYYGRYATFPGKNFADHITPFKGAFAAHTSGIMPTYSILKDLTYKGHKLDQVGAGFNSYLLKDLLRGTYKFDGVIVSDWGITGDCPQQCLDNRPPASFIGPWGVGMPWGVENQSILQRTALTLNAGVDQIGGSDQPSYVVQAVRQKLVGEQRVNEAARRVLEQKFRLGLFENPYVDEEAAGRLVGNAAFQAVGDKAQSDSLTLLKNSDRTLPARGGKVRTVYLHGVSADEAKARGLKVVDDPADADLAVVRLADPRAGSDLTGLEFPDSDPAYQALRKAASTGTPTVAVPKLTRPLILTNITRAADAVMANFGVSDAVLLDTIFGKRSPNGRLPFELPSSMKEVEAQRGDVPDDTAHPLYERGFGLKYR
ncbi:glycoside hydrolase family 3 C-terminal domain-containing protein [Streptomyces sp. NBC_01016]|uniref:glycoside hydrolase family 3 protein n=1 Tax=Streptomyces sp. NBC_01016 TaxID=2903720 RepID=UPI00225138DD|nr:glycoside hydrolase family 3 N-terminal domain-containing protein [Streptomyces sp. NBC_01016]MCX4835039.1 glycoside hydrolase family 3 C-terminal domain-containing protein [Streptomyces sp. NBC_01016]